MGSAAPAVQEAEKRLLEATVTKLAAAEKERQELLAEMELSTRQWEEIVRSLQAKLDAREGSHG